MGATFPWVTRLFESSSVTQSPITFSGTFGTSSTLFTLPSSAEAQWVWLSSAMALESFSKPLASASPPSFLRLSLIIWLYFSAIEAFIAALQNFGQLFADYIATPFGRASRAFLRSVGEVLSYISQPFRAIFSYISQPFRAIFNYIASLIKTIFSSFASFFRALFRHFASLFRTFIDFLVICFDYSIRPILRFTRELFLYVESPAEFVGEFITTSVEQCSSIVKTSLRFVFNFLRTLLSTLFSPIRTGLRYIVTFVWDVQMYFIDCLISCLKAIDTALKYISQTIGSLFSTLTHSLFPFRY